MSFKVNLEVNGITYELLNFEYKMFQETDASGRPSSVVRGGKLTVSLESTASTVFADAMADSFSRLEGKIIFLKRDTNAALKTIEFKEAYVVEYSESFSGGGVTGSTKFDTANDQNPTIETITFSAKTLIIGSTEFNKQWAEAM